MTHVVLIHIDPEHKKFESTLYSVAQETLNAAHAPPGEVSIVLSNQQHVRELNKDYRNIDRPTDVLAFQGEIQDPGTGLADLGDVIIAFEIAETQAAVAGHAVEAELALLVVHGILHLLGFDHSTSEEKSEMWRIQSKILENLDLGINEPE